MLCYHELAVLINKSIVKLLVIVALSAAYCLVVSVVSIDSRN